MMPIARYLNKNKFSKGKIWAASIMAAAVLSVTTYLFYPEGARGSQSVQIFPVADVTVSEAKPGVNYGSDRNLKLDSASSQTGENQVFMKFEIADLGEIQSAIINVYVRNAGEEVTINSSSDHEWNEQTVTYATRPVIDGDEEVNFTPATTGWKQVEITNLVEAVGSNTIVFYTNSLDGVEFFSKDAQTNKPYLEITYELPATPTPTPTGEPTPSPTIEPTGTPTPTIEVTPTPEPSISPTPTPSPTLSPTPEPTISPTPTEVPTPTPTAEPTPTPPPATPTPTPITPTPTLIPPSPTPEPTPSPIPNGIYFPPTGQSLDMQNMKTAAELGMDDSVITQLTSRASRWAIWRHGYLLHVAGNFNKTEEVKSLRKTWHALTVGAAIKQGKIPSYDQPISVWETDLTGKDAEATWWHVMTQSSSFGYPGCGGDGNDYAPGTMWTYSDANPYRLNNALAKAYGKNDYYDNYSDVIKEAYFDEIGLTGWRAAPRTDGIRFNFDLEDMGRLGLLMITRGIWEGEELIPAWFIEEQETKQTEGMMVNYAGCGDGNIDLDPQEFPESPYGYMTWTNSEGDYYPDASTDWAWGWGAGGYYLAWNHGSGVVYAGFGVSSSDTLPTTEGILNIIDENVLGPNPLVE